MHKLTRPTIGITTFGENESGHYHLANTYVEGVRRAGGLPILLPPGQPQEGAAILEVVDGLILSGGGDLDPATYKGPAHPAISHVNPERDRFEITLAKLALNTEIPILGICRGIGVLNVVSGGTLVPHIPDEFGEIVAHMGSTQTVEHQVWIEPKSRLASIVAATEATVVSGIIKPCDLYHLVGVLLHSHQMESLKHWNMNATLGDRTSMASRNVNR